MIRPQTCPICQKELRLGPAGEESADFPFCSQRCREIDLYRWSEGKYAVIEELPPELLAELPPELFDQEPPGP